MLPSADVNIELLKHQIELEESNYKYAVELKKGYDMLRRMRDNIRELKDALLTSIEKQHEFEKGV